MERELVSVVSVTANPAAMAMPATRVTITASRSGEISRPGGGAVGSGITLRPAMAAACTTAIPANNRMAARPWRSQVLKSPPTAIPAAANATQAGVAMSRKIGFQISWPWVA